MSLKHTFRFSGLTSILSVVCVLVISYVIYHSNKPVKENRLSIGSEVPEIELFDVSNMSQKLSHFRGNVVVLNFWATWCPPCVEEMPALLEIYNKFKSRGLVVLGVSVDENKDKLHTFIEKYTITFPVLWDKDSVYANIYGTSGYPETFIIDRKGVLVWHITGPIEKDDRRISTGLEQILTW